MGDRILVVEDDNQQICDILSAFDVYGFQKEKIDVARNLSDAYEFIGDFSDGIKKYVTITLDGDLGTETTITLLREIKNSGYEGFIIAASHSNDTNAYMLKNGCTHQIPDYKFQVAKMVTDLLNTN